jgi:hypothetical protein
MSNVAVFFDNGVRAREAVHDTGVLHVGTTPDNKPPKIPSQAGAGSDVAIGFNDNVTN